MGGEHPKQVDLENNSPKFPVNGSPFLTQKKPEMDDQDHKKMMGAHRMPPASVMTRLILIMVWRKLIRNPNTYSSLLGVIWSLVSYRYIFLLLFSYHHQDFIFQLHVELNN